MSAVGPIEYTAAGIAMLAHGHQRYHTGSYFDLHLRAVAKRVRHLGEWHVAVALLHDVVEDTPVTLEDLAVSLPDVVVEAIRVITHRPDESYSVYVERVCASGNWLALRVKQADLESNIACSHLGDGKYEQMAFKKWSPALALVLRTIYDLENG